MKRKAVRAITGLLCAILFLSNMAGIRAFAMEEVGQEMWMQEHSLEDNTWEDEDEKAEGVEETEQADSDAEPETESKEGDTDSDDEDQEEKEKEAETGSESTVESPDEGAEETVPEDTVEESQGGETVSENTVEETPDADGIPVRASFFPQVYSSGKSFVVDGKTYNSMGVGDNRGGGGSRGCRVHTGL